MQFVYLRFYMIFSVILDSLSHINWKNNIIGFQCSKYAMIKELNKKFLMHKS
jgi:hypothetical protein